jgi:phage tail sheath protein FI
MPPYKTPGVYPVEISVFPPSVAEVETAIPAFIGYTEKAQLKKEGDLKDKPTKVRSLKEFEQYFGGPHAQPIVVTVKDIRDKPENGFEVESIKLKDDTAGAKDTADTEATNIDKAVPKFLLYYSVQLFFANGGGPCYITSVGTYEANLIKDKIKERCEAGLKEVAKQDEPTLIVIPEAVTLGRVAYGDVVKAVLTQCGKLGDRFAILDVLDGSKSAEDCKKTRELFGTESLSYGAAYYPFLRTSLNHYISPDEVNVTVQYPLPPVEVAAATEEMFEATTDNTAKVIWDSEKMTLTSASNAPLSLGSGNLKKGEKVLVKDQTGKPSVFAQNGVYDVLEEGKTDGATEKNGSPWKLGARSRPVRVKSGTKTWKWSDDEGYKTENPSQPVEMPLATLKSQNTALYNFVRAALRERYVVLPPSGLVAGVYAAKDNASGVWASPANVGLAGVIEPMVKLDDKDQESLNVDPDSGKSINAIRSFAARGTLVWGARTLDGNSNEWRYISVRRFFNMVEESARKSTLWAVFKSNDANTWVKVRGMLENYLTQKWREGALAGATTKDAFFVKCGLGTTMSPVDILEGRMNVEIGMAVVRPAEFIILKFSHKLQTS